MKRIAILGAGGFVGMRFAEIAWLEDRFDLVPVVRSPKSFGRISKYGRPCQYADAGNPDTLARAITGCDAVVNLTMGDNARMLPDTESIVAACQAARIPILVHVSSAEIYGRAEDPAINDDSPPPPHWMPYARAKAAAEDWLRLRLGRTALKIVIVRPGLIWGPRSPWVTGPATDLLAGTAVLFGNGEGIANLIHVDNLASAILGIVEAPAVTPGFYNIADAELICWRDYLHALAAHMGLEAPVIHQLPFDAYRESIGSRLGAVKNAAFLKPLKKAIRSQTKWHLRDALIRAASFHRRAPAEQAPSGPNINRSTWWLQGTRRKLPTAKFEKVYPGVPLIDFPEGLRRTAAWMRFAGYSA